MVLTSCLALVPEGAALAAQTSSYAWHVTKTQWSGDDEARYGEFVAALGGAVDRRECNTVQSCLNGRVQHPYRASNPKGMVFHADCADLPYLLRAYFAWKNQLPFSYAREVASRPGSRGDRRYSSRGNYVRAREDMLPASESAPLDARRVFQRIRGQVRSGHFRIRSRLTDPGISDFYPVAIRPGSVRPGTIIYDPKGHVGVIYKVTPAGRVCFIDAHPDNSLTRGSYGLKFTQRSRPDTAPGFKNWRPLRVHGATRTRSGRYLGGRAALSPNRDLPDFSEEQFFGTGAVPVKWSLREFRIGGRRLAFHDFVRHRLGGSGLVYDPVEELRTGVRDLCVDLEYRMLAVDVALRSGIQRKPAPSRLPHNIYGSSGEWEIYSTPSRDARLKTSMKELRDQVARFLQMHLIADPALAYSGPDLRSALFDVYRMEATACRVSYENSAGVRRELSMHDVVERLFRLSFDPYHCVERRWGASSPEELSSCRDGADKRAWYHAQQNLRNQIERRYDVAMGFSVSELRLGGPGSGEPAAPDVSVLGLLSGFHTGAAAGR